MKLLLLFAVAGGLSLFTGCVSEAEKSGPSRISGRAGVVVSSHNTSHLTHEPSPAGPAPSGN